MPGLAGSAPPDAPSVSSCPASVPRETPAPGCIASPAGLSTTTRYSSSYASGTVTGSGSSTASTTCGSSTSTTAPASRRWLFPRAAPSTVTAPSRTRRSARDRVAISSRSASARSRRDPACASATLKRRVATARSVHAVRPVGEDERAEEDRDADDDEGVREVEGRPGDEVEEVRHVPEPDAVDEVGDAPAEDEAERDRQHRMASSGVREEHEHRADRDGGDRDHDRCAAPEEAEGDPGVLDVVDGERSDDVDALAEGEGPTDDLLRQLVGEDRGPRDDEERDPLRPACRERAL